MAEPIEASTGAGTAIDGPGRIADPVERGEEGERSPKAKRIVRWGCAVATVSLAVTGWGAWMQGLDISGAGGIFLVSFLMWTLVAAVAEIARG